MYVCICIYIYIYIYIPALLRPVRLLVAQLVDGSVEHVRLRRQVGYLPRPRQKVRHPKDQIRISP